MNLGRWRDSGCKSIHWRGGEQGGIKGRHTLLPSSEISAQGTKTRSFTARLTSILSRSWRSRSPMPLPRGPDQRAPAALMARTTRWSTKWSAASTSVTATRTAGHMYSMRRDCGPANFNVCAEGQGHPHSVASASATVMRTTGHRHSMQCGEGPGHNGRRSDWIIMGRLLLREPTSGRCCPPAAPGCWQPDPWQSIRRMDPPPLTSASHTDPAENEPHRVTAHCQPKPLIAGIQQSRRALI